MVFRGTWYKMWHNIWFPLSNWCHGYHESKNSSAMYENGEVEDPKDANSIFEHTFHSQDMQRDARICVLQEKAWKFLEGTKILNTGHCTMTIKAYSSRYYQQDFDFLLLQIWRRPMPHVLVTSSKKRTLPYFHLTREIRHSMRSLSSLTKHACSNIFANLFDQRKRVPSPREKSLIFIKYFTALCYTNARRGLVTELVWQFAWGVFSNCQKTPYLAHRKLFILVAGCCASSWSAHQNWPLIIKSINDAIEHDSILPFSTQCLNFVGSTPELLFNPYLYYFI